MQMQSAISLIWARGNIELTHNVVDVGKSGRNEVWVIFPVQLAMEVGRGGVFGIPRALMLTNNVVLNPIHNPTKAP